MQNMMAPIGTNAVESMSPPRKICIIDDDVEYGEFLSAFLRAQQVDVELFTSGSAFLAEAKISSYDFYVVDLGLPGIDGVDLIMLIRAQSNAGVIIISGRMGPDAFNAGLSAGADMFLNKPVRFDQVLQAIKTVSLRVARGGAGATFWELDQNQSELKCSNGPNVKLTPLELQILQVLGVHGGKGCDRKALAEQIGEDQNSARNLDAAIFRLRKKIETTTKRAAPIRTLHGVGYSLTGDVKF
jgi:DNA-binding response OmpR family regulator